jgi:DNA-3-methyladenine glycosylase II
MISQTIALPWPPGFSLAASSRFVMNFAASQGGEEASALNLAFALDRTWQPVGVRVSEHEDTINAEVVTNPESASLEAIRQNLVRILNLHVGHDPFVEIGERDPIVAHLQHRYPGLRPVQFPTPWEAAAWAVIGHRIRITHAAAIKRRLSERFGRRTEFPGGQSLDSFPSPEVVLSLPAMPGLTVRKFDTLRGVARAAVEGALDSEHLLRLPVTEASAELQGLYGIGPFSAELILVRGAGVPDLFPTNEPRLAKAMTVLYRRSDTEAQPRVTEQWRPYRSWVALLIRRWLEDETQEIARGIPVREIPTPVFARYSTPQ